MNLNQVTLPSTDVARSISFYERLGFRLIVKALPRYARFECSEGDATFSLHQVDRLTADTGVWVYFEVQDVEKEVKRLTDAGIGIEELPVQKSWLWQEARLRDPDNNIIILFFAGDNRKNPPWRI